LAIVSLGENDKYMINNHKINASPQISWKVQNLACAYLYKNRDNS